ncbi:HSX11 [Candida margitis]|uniref:HSX11 n=1 Tax=Candida margitis TaxID=1775924 RepID=UPI002225F284|nr:HSX11 [Candida margitis]KAI5970081.1 HSX11 [Candida margitis]
MREVSNFRYGAAIFFLIWYIVISIVANIGFIEILLKFSHRTLLSTKVKRSRYKKETPGEEVNDGKLTYEGVTIIRPIKGIDPELSSCLESSFVQNYPSDKIQLLFCIDDPNDPSVPIIKKLIARYPTIDAEILVSNNFNPDSKSSSEHYGPNPKVNNLAKGFLKAKYDILWVMDSNVWASSNILRNSVFTMNMNLNNGRKVGDKRPVKLVHHVPLAFCIDSISGRGGDDNAMDLEGSVTPTYSEDDSDYASVTSQNSNLTNRKLSQTAQLNIDHPSGHGCNNNGNYSRKLLGAKLDEMFLHSSHSKFYVALNNLSIAPCVNGKSNMYRKSDLDQAVKLIPYKNSPFFRDAKVKSDAAAYTSLGLGHAIKFFARYIGEDNMIGIALWENCNGRTGLTGDVVVQPLSRHDNTVQDYMQRRVRWLRVRKYMVSLATFIEPTTESIVSGVYGTFAMSTLFFHRWFSIKWFLLHMGFWCLSDFIQYNVLINHVKSTASANVTYLPRWMDDIHVVKSVGEVIEWLQVWLLREVLALPIWFIAMFGHEIDWRGRPFKIKKDLTAEEL